MHRQVQALQEQLQSLLISRDALGAEEVRTQELQQQLAQSAQERSVAEYHQSELQQQLAQQRNASEHRQIELQQQFAQQRAAEAHRITEAEVAAFHRGALSRRVSS